jgi:hypothetical protein
VAVGGGLIFTSPDGVNWVQRQSGAQAGLLNASAFGNGSFVAVGGGGTILQSGSTTFTLKLTPSASFGLLKLSLEGPIGLSYTIQGSTNLISWQTLTNFTSTQPTSVIFDPLPVASDRVFYRADSQ